VNHMGRRTALVRRVEQEGLDAFLVVNTELSDHANQYYLTGFTGSLGIVWVGEKCWLGTDSRYTEQAAVQAGELPVHKVEGRWSQWLVERLEQADARRVGLAAANVSVKVLNDLQSSCPDIEFVPTADWVQEARQVKEPEEIERIAAAAELTDKGLKWILGRIHPGISEREVALDLETWYRKQGAEHVAFELIVAAGPHSSRPHHRPGDQELAEGELVLFDVGVRMDGYCSDVTRVVAMGEVPRRVREVYEHVLAANQAGLEAVREGITGADADKAAREVLADAGLGDNFGHGLGHGVGLQVHEGPRLAPAADDELEAGMVVTVEPGAYLAGAFGVRIEDLVVVRPDGCEVLSGFPKQELWSL